MCMSVWCPCSVFSVGVSRGEEDGCSGSLGWGRQELSRLAKLFFNHIRSGWQAGGMVGLGTLRLFVVLLFRSMIEIISKAFSLTLYSPPDSFCLVSPLNVLLFHSVVSRCYLHFSLSSFRDKVIYGFGAAAVTFFTSILISPFLSFFLWIKVRTMSTSF